MIPPPVRVCGRDHISQYPPPYTPCKPSVATCTQENGSTTPVKGTRQVFCARRRAWGGMGRDDGVLETCSAEVRVNGKRRQGSDPLPKHTHTSLAVFHRKMCSSFVGQSQRTLGRTARRKEEGGFTLTRVAFFLTLTISPRVGMLPPSAPILRNTLDKMSCLHKGFFQITVSLHKKKQPGIAGTLRSLRRGGGSRARIIQNHTPNRCGAPRRSPLLATLGPNSNATAC